MSKFVKLMSFTVIICMSLIGTSYAKQDYVLTPEQESLMDGLYEKFRNDIEPYEKEIKNKSSLIKKEFKKELPDRTIIEGLHTEIGTLKGKIAVEKLNLMDELKKNNLPVKKGKKKSKQKKSTNGKLNKNVEANNSRDDLDLADDDANDALEPSSSTNSTK